MSKLLFPYQVETFAANGAKLKLNGYGLWNVRVTEIARKRPGLETPFLASWEICALGLASAHGMSACLRLLLAHTESDLEVIITYLLTAERLNFICLTAVGSQKCDLKQNFQKI